MIQHVADALTRVVDFINSPPGQIGIGIALAGGTWKFFEGLEKILTVNTRIQISLWLIEPRPIGIARRKWNETLVEVFEEFYGKNHWSWKCFKRSAQVSFVLGAPAFFVNTYHVASASGGSVAFAPSDLMRFVTSLVETTLFVNILPDYLSLLVSRILLSWLRFTWVTGWFVILSLDMLLSVYIAGFVAVTYFDIVAPLSYGMPVIYDLEYAQLFSFNGLVSIFNRIETLETLEGVRLTYRYVQSYLWLVCLVPAASSSIWLWFYAGSGFVIKTAQRLDLGIRFFQRVFDIENHPLSAIGLVGGTLVALIYWTVVIALRA
jgi:hypothetical protein